MLALRRMSNGCHDQTQQNLSNNRPSNYVTRRYLHQRKMISGSKDIQSILWIEIGRAVLWAQSGHLCSEAALHLSITSRSAITSPSMRRRSRGAYGLEPAGAAQSCLAWTPIQGRTRAIGEQIQVRLTQRITSPDNLYPRPVMSLEISRLSLAHSEGPDDSGSRQSTKEK